MRRIELLVVIVCLCLCVPAWAGGTFVQHRLVQWFDFDERDEGNFEDLPKAWYAIGRDTLNPDVSFQRQPLHQQLTIEPGYPKYNVVRFDKRQAASGAESLYLGVNGGNTGAFLEVGAVPAVPGSDYLMTAQARTSGLQHARGQFSAYFIDARGQRIDESIVHSPMTNTKGEWQTLSLRLSGDFPQAAYIGLQVRVLQARADPQDPLGKHQLVFQDVEGGAWFDDVMIWQLPSVSLKTDTAVNVVRAPKRPTVTAEIRDLTGRMLKAHMALYDIDMRRMAEDWREVGDGQPGTWQWELPVKRYGWYLADLNVYEGEPSADFDAASPIARTLTSLLWVPDESLTSSPDAASFHVIAEDLPADQLLLIPQMMDETGLAAVTLSAWDAETTHTTLDRRMGMLDTVIQPILGRGKEVSLSLSPLPLQMSRAMEVDNNSPLSMLARDPTEWEPMLAPVLMRHGPRVRTWQVGSIHAPDGMHQSNLHERLIATRKEFQNLAPQPRLLVPWRLDQVRQSDIADAADFLLDVPYAIHPNHIDEHLAEWRSEPAAVFGLHFREPDATRMTQIQRARDLTLRMLYGWESGAESLAVSAPWTRSDERRVSVLPDPLLGVFTGVANRLSGRRVVGRLDLGPGIQCMIFNGSSGGMLVAWNDFGDEEEAVLDMYLGPTPIATDAWGNRAIVPVSAGRHVWKLDRMPIFIEGIDPQLALFRAGFRLDRPFIRSLQAPHERTVTLVNPWPRTISGYMHILGPESWRIEPRRTFFSIAAGQSTKINLQMTFPYAEVAGHKRLTAKFDFVAQQQYVVNVGAPMELGLEDVDFDASLAVFRRSDGTLDLVVTSQVTNRGDTPLAMYAFANVGGLPRQERVISGLRPGQSIVRRFRFEAVEPTSAGDRIRVGLRQAGGPAVLNKILKIETENPD